MEGIIKIRGEIGTDVTLESVQAQIDRQRHATEWTAYINSEGGEVYEGLSIYQELRNLKNLTTIADTLCASIASVILQAGSVRKAVRGTDIMVHNPFGQMQGEASDMRAAAEHLDRLKSKIISLYRANPKLSKKSPQELAAAMDQETWMDEDQAIAAGFIDEAIDKLRAVAKFDFKKSNMEDNKEVKGWLEKLSTQFDQFFAKAKIDVNAKNIIAETLETGGEIQVQAEEGEDWTGKPATIDGTPAAPGEYKLASGETVVIGEGSVVSTVKEPEMENKELEAAKAQIEELKKQLETKSGEAAAATKAATDAAAMVANMKTEFTAFKNSLDKEVFGENGKPPIRPRNDAPKEEEVFEGFFTDFHAHAIEVMRYANRNIQ